MMHRRLIGLALALLGAGCLPTFEDAECYADVDCPASYVCAATTCVLAAPDAGPEDAGFEDSGVVEDTGVADGGPVDTGAPDAGFADSGLTPDAGFEDAGFEDAGFPDSGPPDAGFDVRLEPDTVDFGVVRIGCAVPSRQVTLHNAGPTSVEITSVARNQSTSGEYSVTSRATPFTLASGATESVDVVYTPQNVGVDTGAIEATWGNPAQLVGTNLRAEGVLSSQRTDTFTQVGGPLDVLFVVHDASGMAPFQDQLADDLTFLTLVLAYEGWDYHLGVTTADMSATGPQGALLGTPTYLTPQSAGVEAALAARIRVGEGGAMAQAGMEAARAALSAPLSTTGANAGFRRPDAALLVIFLGNEDDASASNVSVYAAFFNGLAGAGHEDRIATNVIVADTSFCAVSGGSASYAGRYLGLAPLTGGYIEYICGGTYQDGVSTMPDIVRNPSFVLQAAPDPLTLVVRVDGSVVPSDGGANWQFDAATNAVVFTEAAAPALGLSVEVDYTIACL